MNPLIFSHHLLKLACLRPAMSPKPSTSHSTAKSSVSVYKETLASLRPPIASMLNLLTKSSTARRSSSSISNNTALPTSDGQSTTIPTSQAYADLVSLSKLCSAHITALGIALKPKADHAAAKAMLDKWLVELNKMDLLVSVWISTCQNGVWDKEVRWAVLGLVESFEVRAVWTLYLHLSHSLQPRVLTTVLFISEPPCHAFICNEHAATTPLSHRPGVVRQHESV